MTNPKDVLEWMERQEQIKREQTNEEWFCGLSTEEKAKVIGQIANNAYQCCQDGKTNKCVNRQYCTGYCDYGWELWLKQPYNEKE